MAPHTAFQSYKTNICMQCITGTLGCRWHRYQQSRRPNRKRDLFWYIFFAMVFFYLLFFFYFWLISENNFDDLNWYLYTQIDSWFNWYSLFLGLSATAIIYFSILMLLSLCHIAYGHQIYIHPIHLTMLFLTLAFCIAATAFVQRLWTTQWDVIYLSFFITGPFLYIGAVFLATLAAWIVAEKWMLFELIYTRLICITVYVVIIAILYAIPAFIHSPCVLHPKDLPSKPKIIAHRGASWIAPENTEIAFQFAVDYGAYGVETDVRVSYDGVLFLMHDKNLRRTTDVEDIYPDSADNRPSLFNYSQLLALDAGSWFIKNNPMGARLSDDDKARYRMQKIMTFPDLLQLAKSYRKRVMYDTLYPHGDNPFSKNFTKMIDQAVTDSGIEPSHIWRMSSIPIPSPFNYTHYMYGMRDPKRLVEGGVFLVNSPVRDDVVKWIKLYRQYNISTLLYPVNTKWLFSLFWCLGVSSVNSDMCHILANMTSPVWTMTPSTYVILWVVVDCVSAIAILAIFIIQRFRFGEQIKHNRESFCSEDRSTPTFTETTFQSRVTMKQHLIPSTKSTEFHNSLEGTPRTYRSHSDAFLPYTVTNPSVDHTDTISLDGQSAKQINERPPITDFSGPADHSYM